MKGKFRDFGELYNAAFAERDPEKKLNLLSEVRRVIAEWEQVLQTPCCRRTFGRKASHASSIAKNGSSEHGKPLYGVSGVRCETGNSEGDPGCTSLENTQ